jgi:hypothetical protein
MDVPDKSIGLSQYSGEITKRWWGVRPRLHAPAESTKIFFQMTP